MGNPTKSVEVNNFLKLVGKFEVRKKGKPSRAKRALKKVEFLFALQLLQNREKDFQRYQMPAMMTLQYHLIGRSDDICKLETNSFFGHANPRFSRFALQIKVTWSKAVYEERQCPEQIILGSMDSNFCFFISFAMHLSRAKNVVWEWKTLQICVLSQC
jgi:hypothetical protein